MSKPNNQNVLHWDLATLAQAIKERQISPIEVTRQLFITIYWSYRTKKLNNKY
jgi:hypothetical protein